ncbi:Adenosylcobalamin biosynthesis, ATP:cob(I)alamin adenosyltransferase-like protein, partial [Ochromonadaceae sp. CCMP2298]
RLTSIQCRLFDLGAAVATPFTSSSSEDKRAFTRFEKHHTEGLEKVIDELDAQLPPLTNFVIPSGGLSSLHLNLARTVCRRAERSAVPLVELGLVDAEVGRYLNRLSDLLFAAGRVAVMREKQEEIIWVKGE